MKIGIPGRIVACILAASLAFPAQALAVAESDDQSDLSADRIAEAIASGEVSASGTSDDGAQSEEDAQVSANASSSYALATIGGETRYDTSAQEALAAFSSAGTVILAGGESYADSIAISGLAGALDAPVLLVDPVSMGDVTKSAIESLRASNIIIAGEVDAVSATVESQAIEMVGEQNVVRLGGQDRYETQMMIYEYGAGNGLFSDSMAVVVTGENFPDALSVSTVAFAQKAPIFFIDGEGALSEAQQQALSEGSWGVFLLIGGEDVAPVAVEDELGLLGGVVRLGGGTRYDTAKLIGDYAVSNLGFSWDGVAFASGNKPWDCLGAAAMQGKQHRLISLLDDNGAKTEPSVYVSGKPASAVFLGGKSVYSNAFKAQFAYKMGYSLLDIEGFKVFIDAGHGQNNTNNGAWDSGATGPGYLEANLTSDLADRVAERLRSDYGLDVYVCKDGWYKLRQTRASLEDCGVYVALHFNASGGTGTETYTHSYNAAWGSTRLQGSVHPKLVSAIGLTDRGQKQDEFAVCSGKVPAVLCEVCFIDRLTDMAAYVARKDSVAAAIAQGIVQS